MAILLSSTFSSTSPPSAFTGVIIGLVSSFGSIILIALLIFVFWISGCSGGGRILLDRIGRPGEYDDEQAFARDEAEALETMDEMARAEYLRAKGMLPYPPLPLSLSLSSYLIVSVSIRCRLTNLRDQTAFVTANPPESLQTEISLSQYLAIQEKGVSAWEFEPELEIANCFVEARTEIEFFDSECTVLTNLPVPKQNDVYYWEAKIYDKPETTLLSIGMATKPYPLFRLPGFHKYSAAYQSTGHRRYNQPFSDLPYGPAYVQGDVIGVGYRPRTGAIFFTRNGKRLEEVVHGLKGPNFFPAVGAIGPATVHVNFGQAGFVFIEANVKKWGLAPVTGSLAPPPPYGSEQGSILLETGNKDGFVGGSSAPGTAGRPHSQSVTGTSYSVRHHNPHADHGSTNGSSLNAPSRTHGRTRSGNHFRILPPTSPGPVRSPTDISLAHLVPTEESGEPSSISHPDGPDGRDGRDGREDENPLRLHLEDATNPPPGYASPTEDDANSAFFTASGPHGQRRRRMRSSTVVVDSDTDDDRPLVQVANRNRGDSAATVIPPPSRRASVISARNRQRSQSQLVPAPDEPVPSYFDAMRQGAGHHISQRRGQSGSGSGSRSGSGFGSGSGSGSWSGSSQSRASSRASPADEAFRVSPADEASPVEAATVQDSPSESHDTET
ncbi:SPRY protein [Geosmithia morbida]|uniref:Protein SSH4 n=1 Tax=Geosmithia morbida TaxID=1094350 RepID=A0A9P5D3I3_9HYPO|nr:SPRY protein [Geosmithia morbida]KAF4121820.1 SPRY protein [Geosmithia morbida]